MMKDDKELPKKGSGRRRFGTKARIHAPSKAERMNQEYTHAALVAAKIEEKEKEKEK